MRYFFSNYNFDENYFFEDGRGSGTGSECREGYGWGDGETYGNGKGDSNGCNQYASGISNDFEHGISGMGFSNKKYPIYLIQYWL